MVKVMGSRRTANLCLRVVVLETSVKCSIVVKHGSGCSGMHRRVKFSMAGKAWLDVCAASAGAPHGTLAQGSGAPHQENQAEV